MANYKFNMRKIYSKSDIPTDGYSESGYNYQFDGYDITVNNDDKLSTEFVDAKSLRVYRASKRKCWPMLKAALVEYENAEEENKEQLLKRYNQLSDGYDYYVGILQKIEEK